MDVLPVTTLRPDGTADMMHSDAAVIYVFAQLWMHVACGHDTHS